jgi:glycolate oxidase iron-sulfur subunit
MKLALAFARGVPKSLVPACLRASLHLLPEKSVSVTLPEVSPATTPTKRGRVGLITGCVQSVMFGETNAATVRLLNAAGHDVVIPRAQVCCGALDAHTGNLKRAREFARRNIEVFEQHQLDAIIINAAGCGSTLKEYGHLLGDERGRLFSAKVKDLSEFMVGKIQNPKSQIQNRVTFHDACHLAHAQRITKPPRDLVRAVAGENFVELPEAEVCCGSAGSYNLTEPAMAERLQRRKVENIVKTGAQIVVTTNPGCILQLRAGLRAAGAGHVRVLHLADYLAEFIQPA